MVLVDTAELCTVLVPRYPWLVTTCLACLLSPDSRDLFTLWLDT